MVYRIFFVNFQVNLGIFIGRCWTINFKLFFLHLPSYFFSTFYSFIYLLSKKYIYEKNEQLHKLHPVKSNFNFSFLTERLYNFTLFKSFFFFCEQFSLSGEIKHKSQVKLSLICKLLLLLPKQRSFIFKVTPSQKGYWILLTAFFCLIPKQLRYTHW